MEFRDNSMTIPMAGKMTRGKKCDIIPPEKKSYIKENLMENYFAPALTPDQLRAIGLAHMGDAVFEVLVRTWLCEHGKATGKGLHQATIRLVCAESQAEKAEKILPLLTEEEHAVFKRGRNAHTARSGADYHRATGLESLFGYLYLAGRIDRVRELFALCVEE